MLSHLTIRSLAVIDRIELDCAPGMTALTGETGAGKSIVVDALALLLGARAHADLIRAGAERAEVCGVFETGSNPPVRTWLADRELDEGADECIVRRIIGPGGRSRAFVNDRPIAAHLLRELGEHLVDIHGQHAHHLLLNRDRQRLLVDHFGGHQELLDRVAATAGRWRKLRRELAAIISDGEDRAARLDFLRYQLEELDRLGLGADEPERLAAEQRRLANASPPSNRASGELPRSSARQRTRRTNTARSALGSRHCAGAPRGGSRSGSRRTCASWECPAEDSRSTSSRWNRSIPRRVARIAWNSS